MDKKRNAAPQPLEEEKKIEQDPEKEKRQEEETGKLTEVKNASASGLGTIGRSGEPVDKKGGGKEY